jgi:hypothetical protein
MAARGSVLKSEISKKILQTFPGSFLYNDGKEIRINGFEDGQLIQIKLSLTASKTAVENENAAPLTEKTETTTTKESSEPSVKEKIPQEPSEEEKQRLTNLLNKLGL